MTCVGYWSILPTLIQKGKIRSLPRVTNLRIFLLAALAASLASPTVAGGFALCDHWHPQRQGCVVDGDTFWWQGEKFRPSGYDAPEAKGQFCPAAGPVYYAAQRRLLELLNAGDVGIERTGVDRYGRSLATVTIGGRDLAEIMIGEGLAHPWSGQHWCG